MDVKDAFAKLREQVMVCAMSPMTYRGGLHVVNSTNLEYFEPQEKAELFRLKALFQEKLIDSGTGPQHPHMHTQTEIQQTYSSCVQVCPTYAKGWLSWGQACNRILESSSHTPVPLSARSELGVSVAVCILKAVAYGNEPARLLLGRVLWLCMCGDDNSGNIASYVATFGSGLPEWVWIPFLPYMIAELCRNVNPQIQGSSHVQVFKSLLAQVCVRYPQAIFYLLRDSSTRKPRHVSYATHITENLIDDLRRVLQTTHMHLYTAMLVLCDCAASGLKTSLAEDVVLLVETLLMSMLRHSGQELKLEGPSKDSFVDPIFNSLSKCRIPRTTDPCAPEERFLW
jgi:hypothetical protein